MLYGNSSCLSIVIDGDEIDRVYIYMYVYQSAFMVGREDVPFEMAAESIVTMLTANDEGGEETVAYHEQSAPNTAAEETNRPSTNLLFLLRYDKKST